jgi:hypothetical protein
MEAQLEHTIKSNRYRDIDSVAAVAAVLDIPVFQAGKAMAKAEAYRLSSELAAARCKAEAVLEFGAATVSDEDLKQIAKLQKKLEQALAAAKFWKFPAEVKDFDATHNVYGGVTRSQVEEARSVPVLQLIESSGQEVRKDMTTECPWCSCQKLQINRKNTVFCYNCNQGGDSIELAQKLQNVDFVSAVRYLISL